MREHLLLLLLLLFFFFFFFFFSLDATLPFLIPSLLSRATRFV
jgi:hypothetical protein